MSNPDAIRRLTADSAASWVLKTATVWSVGTEFSLIVYPSPTGRLCTVGLGIKRIGPSEFCTTQPKQQANRLKVVRPVIDLEGRSYARGVIPTVRRHWIDGRRSLDVEPMTAQIETGGTAFYASPSTHLCELSGLFERRCAGACG